MNARADRRQAGVVLVLVLHVLTLFGLTGVAFVTYSAAERQCEQNPTAEARDGRCVREVGTTEGRP
jgi:Tfp pilus assembly protein PilX